MRWVRLDPKLKPVTTSACLVGHAVVGPAHEGATVGGAQRHAFHVQEQIEARDAKDHSFNERSQELVEMVHGFLRSDRLEELGPRLNPHRGQSAARRKADAPDLVVQAEAVLAPPVGGQAEDEVAQLKGHGPRRPVGENALLLQAGQEALGEAPVTREVEGIDSRGEFHRSGSPGR